MANPTSLIEDYLPIQAISAEASREKSVRKGHISTLHLWWARRPLVACRAAVYGALVPASRFVPNNGSDQQKKSLGRANAAKFVEKLCKYPGDSYVIAEAQKHILEAHAERLSQETGKKITVEDILQGRAPRPKVLDMFAGGGAIPLEALRLGCEAYALDLNPVAHIIELCTLVYPQKYGKPDKTAKGSAKDGTWAGLAEEVRHWGSWVLQKVKAEIGDLYPPIPDPKAPKTKQILGEAQLELGGEGFATSGQQHLAVETPAGYLTPAAYLWTRTVKCKNPACGATVPLARQTWLCKKKGRYVALKIIAPKRQKQVRFEVVEASSEKGLGFNPEVGSRGGNATCPFCGTVADSDYVQTEGCAGRRGEQMMGVVAVKPWQPGKRYLSALESGPNANAQDIAARIERLCQSSGLSILSEEIGHARPSPNARGLSPVTRHGFRVFADLFTSRQSLCLLTFANAIRTAPLDGDAERQKAVRVCLSLVLDRVADYCSNFCQWRNNLETVGHTFARHALAMLWDFAEGSPLFGTSGTWSGMLEQTCNTLSIVGSQLTAAAAVERGSAFNLSWGDSTVDAVVTDPPYYDNVPYADISDFFYVWLKRSIGHTFPEHFSSTLTPKKNEATALASRHKGDFGKATKEYEDMMLTSFREAHRVLKPGGTLVIVYAHKTTLGWATLVNAVRDAGFTVAEAWPLDTEMGVRLIAQDTAALASSVFLVARKRQGAETGAYEEEVKPELDRIVRERVETLWQMGITGGNLIIAAVGAGLRAFTRFGRVEYANGEEVPAGKFLAEVEGVVLETLLEKIFGVPRSGVASVDGPSRFYVLWRYAYGTAELDAGEAIVFTYGQQVELDGSNGLSGGNRGLVEKKKGAYRLRDFTERGADEKLGLPENGPLRLGEQSASLIDVLHRILWLIENKPRNLAEFLDEVHPDRERLRLVAQALAGAGLKGKSEQEAKTLVTTTASEQAALGKLLANWRSLVDQRLAAAEETLFSPKK